MPARLTVYLPEDLDIAMRVDAHNKGQKLSTWVERAIAAALANDEVPSGHSAACDTPPAVLPD